MIESAWDYHNKTAYSRAKMSGHSLDWTAQPEAFKIYQNLQSLELSIPPDQPAGFISELLRGDEPAYESALDMKTLARILILSHAITATARFSGQYFHYRSVASAGALYPFELYPVVCGLEGLSEGVYHYDPGTPKLSILKKGDPWPETAVALDVDASARPSVVFFLTAIYFRSSWKYRDRAYRYHLLDTGHLAENLCSAIASCQLPFELSYDFDDKAVNGLVGLDSSREVCLCRVVVRGRTPEAEVDPIRNESNQRLSDASRVSQKETDYPVIRAIHSISSRIDKTGAESPSIRESIGVPLENGMEIPIHGKTPEIMTCPEAVFQRRSMRNFVKSALPKKNLDLFLELLCRDWKDVGVSTESYLSVGFLAGNVEGVEPGFYTLNADNMLYHSASHGFMIDKMADVCLNQAWLANCAVHFLFMTNIKLIEKMRGPRAYRYAMCSAGRLGQRIYLAATAMNLGCCGIGAFFDDEASQLLGLNEESRLLYLVGAGPVKKKSQ